MNKIMTALLMILSTTQAFANQDLVLDGERWLAKFTAYVCDDGNTQAQAIPQVLVEKNVVFTTASSDHSLDNVLLKATFTEQGTTCNYSALLHADNAQFNVGLVNSNAYSTDGNSTCEEGKAFLDQVLEFNTYKYLHGRVAIYIPFADSAALCGSDKVGLHLQVTGKVQ